ncbi:MAG: BTAD domain-containing putative transcriptional regulator, partial [Chloroflexota bacterium]
MAGELRLKLLGGCELTIDGEPLDKLFAKHQALLAFLAMTGQTHARQMIAGLLWGGKSEQDALRNLRVNLTKVRQIAGAYLAVGRQTIAFDQTSNYWLDVEAFEDCVERSRGANGRLNHALLREAVNLYDGDFMVGFELRDAPEFEEWLLSQRARLQPILIQALDALVEHCVDEGNYAEGIAYAYKLLDIEPWREETHQQLMWLLALDGQHSAALAQYDECCLILQRELGVLPMLETTQLKTDIQTMREKLEMRQTKPLPPLPDPEPETAVPFLAPPPVPYFLGRATEIDQLWQSICRENGQQRFVISGMGGVGKTALVIQFAHVLRQEFPDGVLWVKADSSDPMQIAEQWAAAYGYDFGSVADPASRMGALRQMLAEKKALLIFDDVAEAARIRPLLPTAGDCIMLFTTRNANLAPLLAASRLALHELSEKNGRLLLTHLIGQTRVEAESDAADHIGERLQNLPLALTIAGRYLAQRPRRRLSTFVTRLHEQGQRLATLELDNLAVRLSFMISWQALDTTQQEIFRYLGVFAGRAFTVEALAAVAQLHTFTAEDRLHTLVMLSLLGEEGEHHYRQHSLLADFAQEQLGEDENAHSRKVHFFLEFAQTYHTNYQMLEPEWANLLASVSTAQQLQQWQDILKLTQTLEQAWFARGRYSDAKLAYKIAYEASIQL